MQNDESRTTYRQPFKRVFLLFAFIQNLSAALIELVIFMIQFHNFKSGAVKLRFFWDVGLSTILNEHEKYIKQEETIQTNAHIE